MAETENWWANDPVVAKPSPADAWWANDPVARPATSKASPVTTTGLVRAAAEGIPVVGGLLNKANAATYAALGQLVPGDTTVSHATSDEPGLAGYWEGLKKRYGENLAREEAKSAQFEQEHPIASTAAGIAGGTAATLPLAATATGARLLGLGGRTLPAQIRQGALSGAAINAADALTRGGDLGVGGLVGGVVGGAAPAVARGVGMVAQPIISTARGIANPSGEAAARVGAAVQRAQDLAAATPGNVRNPLTEQEFQAAVAAGRPVNLMDVAGEPGRRLARSAANTSAEGGAILNQAIDDRFESQSPRLSDWLNSTFNYPNAALRQQALERSQSITDNANYARAMTDGDRSIWSPALERLASSPAVMEAMQRATKAVSNEAVIGGYAGMNPKFSFTPDGRLQPGRGPTGAPVYPNLQFWDMTRRQLSDAANQAEARQQDTAFRQLSLLARQMNGALDSEVPSYAAARAGHEAFEGAQNALDAGRNYATRARIDNRAAQDAIMRMNIQERQLFQDGFVDSLIQKIRSVPDRQNVVAKIANSPAAQQQMQIALGPQRARELMGMLHLESVMDRARQAVQGNSTTARQLHELGLAGGAFGAYAAGSGGTFNPDPTSVASAALLYAAGRGRSAINERVAEQVARLLTSNDLPRVRMGMTMLGNNRGLLDNLRNANAALARAGAAQTNRALQ